ncbi:uncharacterized protein G2W53_022986 [Senna tora]|uniref:Uncharacterized protein n=1 Tax=Senna tora TaxID=362788 RepID=A0A834WJ80_9FABA|nr:uncharacterized protein G2W53_022986 [Senna tora]
MELLVAVGCFWLILMSLSFGDNTTIVADDALYACNNKFAAEFGSSASRIQYDLSSSSFSSSDSLPPSKSLLREHKFCTVGECNNPSKMDHVE